MASRFSILAITGMVPPSERIEGLRLLDVRGLPHEGEGHVVDAVLHAEGQVSPVLLGEGGGRELHPRQVHALVALEQAAVHHLGEHPLALDTSDPQLEVAVVEEDAVARASRRGAGGRRWWRSARSCPSTDSSVVMASGARPRARRRRPSPARCGSSGPRGPGGAPPARPVRAAISRTACITCRWSRVVAVREVEPDHVDAGLDQPLEDLRDRGRRDRWWRRSWCAAFFREYSRRV